MQEFAFIHAQWPAPDNVVALSTTRRGGVSKAPYDSFNLAHHVDDDAGSVARNRELLATAAGVKGPIQWLQQVHSSRVITADARVGSNIPEADAVILKQPGAAGAVLTADCLPVFFASRDGKLAAVAHAGWRGLAAGILQETVAALAVAPDELTVWLGPAIGQCHFEVGDDVRSAFMELAASPAQEGAFAAAFEPVVSAAVHNKWMADLYVLARLILADSGIVSVSGGGLCTFCDDRFYSFRENAVTGRMASLIFLKP